MVPFRGCNIFTFSWTQLYYATNSVTQLRHYFIIIITILVAYLCETSDWKNHLYRTLPALKLWLIYVPLRRLRTRKTAELRKPGHNRSILMKRWSNRPTYSALDTICSKWVKVFPRFRWHYSLCFCARNIYKRPYYQGA